MVWTLEKLEWIQKELGVLTILLLELRLFKKKKKKRPYLDAISSLVVP